MTKLSKEQKNNLFEHGYVHIPEFVPKNLVRDALRAINASLGQHLDFYHGQILKTEALCPNLKSDKRILDLFDATNARSVCESALGVGKVVLSPNVQIALNFPCSESFDLDPHVDSFHPSKDGAPGKITPFTAIAGIYLNELSEDWSGNFTVWPGTHRLFEQYHKKNKPDPDMKFGIPPVPMPKPIQLKVKAGDMVFAHFQLAHDASANMSEAIRYAVYFRMNHVEQGKEAVETLSDIWRYWDEMKDLRTQN